MERTTTLVANPGCKNQTLCPKRRTLRRTGQKNLESQPPEAVEQVYNHWWLQAVTGADELKSAEPIVDKTYG